MSISLLHGDTGNALLSGSLYAGSNYLGQRDGLFGCSCGCATFF